MKRLKAVPMASGAVLALTGALIAASPAVAGEGQGQGPVRKTLALTYTTTQAFGFPLTPSLGETFGTSGTVTAQQDPSTVIGSFSNICTIVALDNSTSTMSTQCSSTTTLTSGPYGTGEISTQGEDTGPVDTGPLTFTDIVTGGIGAFNAAGGSASFTTPSEDSKDVVFRLVLPGNGKRW
ncbi:hypothetical protein [Streptomyces sp. NPDC127084]|uniref:hypothetical protein n=1 Tax=Streptomyces sp. NPDC127084 TaxID=3347133 RepID=UPI00364D40A2